MMNNAFITLLASGEMTRGASRMASYDPHGWTLSLVAVSVVFVGLIVLFCVYSFSGALFTGKFKRKSASAELTRTGLTVEHEDEIAAAIAMALDAEAGNEIEVAISTALHLYFSECPHDEESGIITIVPRNSSWANKAIQLQGKL